MHFKHYENPYSGLARYVNCAAANSRRWRGNVWCLFRNTLALNRVPSGWLLRSSKQVNWFFLQPWWACRWPCPSVCPSFLSNQLTYGLIGDAISDTFMPQKTSPPHLFFIWACSLHPGLLRLSDLSLLLLLLLMTSLGSEPESNSSTLAALQIGCLRPPLPLFDLGR